MARYTPGNVSDANLSTELGKIAQALDTSDSMLNLAMLYAQPDKFREGSLVLADGTTWNPGSGPGVYCYIDGAWVLLKSNGRELLAADRTYYVRTDGSDSNTGLADTAGGAFLTIQKAIDIIRSSLDIGAGVTVTIQLADGTYTTTCTIGSFVGAGSLVIQGNSVTPANVLCNVTAGCFTMNRANVTIKWLKVASSAGIGFIISDWSQVISVGVDFGACAVVHMAITTWSSCTMSGAYTISGASQAHFYLLSCSRVTSTGLLVTITGTPAITNYVDASSAATAYLNTTTYSGSATGTRYNVRQNSILETGGATLPGNVAGTTATGGQYL